MGLCCAEDAIEGVLRLALVFVLSRPLRQLVRNERPLTLAEATCEPLVILRGSTDPTFNV